MKLGVNIDHVATLRQVRAADYPCPIEAARLTAAGGADSTTVHLRIDRRHIQDADLYALRDAAILPINLEMANDPAILEIALDIHPAEVCLVPERTEEITTEGGLDAVRHLDSLRPTVQHLADAGIRVSLFIEPDPRQLDAARELGAPVVELHTGIYSHATGAALDAEQQRLTAAAIHGHSLGLQINAGHGLNTQNLPRLLETVPHLHTLNIGHSIVARSVMVGMVEATREIKALMPP